MIVSVLAVWLAVSVGGGLALGVMANGVKAGDRY
jgi:hypothetical protein